MKLRLLVFWFLLLAPGAMAAGPIWLDIERFVVQDLTSAEDVSSIHERPGPAGQSVQCTGGDFTTISPADGYFRFAEPMESAGCGLLQATIVPPPGATALTVEFEANRVIEDAGSLQTIGFEQVLRIRGPGQNHVQDLFDAGADASGSMAFTDTVELRDGPLTVEWWLNDKGFPSGLSEATTGLVSTGGYASQVQNIRMVFGGFDAEAELLDRFKLAGGVRIDERMVVQVVAPELEGTAGQRLVFAYPGEHKLDHVVTPGGKEVPGTQMPWDTANQVSHLSFNESFLAAHGAGAYELHFDISEAYDRSPLMSTILSLCAVAMAVTMGVTGSTYISGRRQFSRVNSAIGTIALTAIVFLTVLGIAMAIWLFVTGAWSFAGATPISRPGMAVLTYLVGGTLALLVVLMVLLSTMKVAAHQAELERSNRELDEFSHIITHDLRAPLRTVSTFTGLLQKKHGEKLPEEAKEFVELVNGGAVRMAKLLDAVGHYSRVGRRDLQLEDVNLKKLVDDVRRDLRRDLIDAGARVQASNLPTVRAEPALMRELLLNLVQNAVKFRALERKPLITIRAKQTGAGFMLTVADNGRGMDEREMKHIFEPFHRGAGAASVAGTGMGLAVCRRIAERHGGRLGVESSPGKGTTFFLHLPDA